MEFNLSVSGDGFNHINVYSRGKTDLGKMLSNFAYSPFVLPDHGSFSSIEGYWYWLTRKDDRLRLLDGFEAKKLGRALPSPVSYTHEEFTNFVKKALDAKLRTHRDLRIALARSTLPLIHYYVERFDGAIKIVIPENSIWIMDHLAHRRQQLAPSVTFTRLDLEGLELQYRKEAKSAVPPPPSPQLGLF